MARIDLQVPISEKEDAKRLGARWDRQRRTWYVPEHVDPAPLRQWLPEPQPPNIRASSWWLVSSLRQCWQCQRSSCVFALMLPAGYEALYVADDPAEDEWERGEHPALLSYVGDVAPAVAAVLRARAPRYRVDFSQTTRTFYWMNHCEHCDAKLGDYETLEEPDTFHGVGADRPRARSRQEITAPFSASCGTYGEWIGD